MLNIKWSKYIPANHRPHKKQLAFLALPHDEALYGGAAGGGKSDALLMGALAWCDTPGFSAIIFRRTITDAALPSSILSRAKLWLEPFVASGEVKFDPKMSTFHFPSGAKLCIGYLKSEGIQARYQGGEYQYIGFDELTQFQEDEYRYLNSRLRRIVGMEHIPLKLRAATNPGNIGHLWVKKYFGITKDETSGEWIGTNPDAPFISAKLLDNPSIDPTYTKQLAKLNKVERERLANGDWDVVEDSVFKDFWFANRYTYKENSTDRWYKLTSIDGIESINHKELYIFTTVDCAVSTKTGIQGVSFIKDQPASHSVISTWGCTHDYKLLLLDNQRFQSTIPELLDRICGNQKLWNPLYNIIEKNGPGEGVCQISEQRGLPVRPVSTKVDKLINSTAAQFRAEKGQIWIPAYANWLKEWEDEIFAWTGHKHEPNDQVDALSNAAIEAMELSLGYERDMALRRGLKRAVPISRGGIAKNTGRKANALHILNGHIQAYM